MAIRILAAGAACFVLAGAAPAAAQVGWGDPFQVSMPTDGSRNVLLPDAATNAADGETLVAYGSDAANDNAFALRVRRLAASGAPVGDELPIEAISAVNKAAGEAAVAADAEHDRWLVAFTADTDATASAASHVFVQLLDGSAAQIGPDDQQVSTATSGGLMFPDVAYSPAADRYLVVWQQSGNIFGQLLAADGTKAGGVLQISEAGPGLNFGGVPSVAVNASGEFLVVFMRTTTYPYYGIYRQRVATTGAFVPDGDDEPVALPADADDGAAYPAVGHDPATDQYLVAFNRIENAASRVAAQRLLADGTPSGAEIPVSQSPANVAVEAPGVAGGGSFVVTWVSGGKYWSQLLGSDGTPAGGDEEIGASGTTNAPPAVTRLSGNWLTVFQAPTTSPGTGAFARLGAGGAPPPGGPPPGDPPPGEPPPGDPPPAALPSFGTLVKLPSAKRCVARRRLRLRLLATDVVVVRATVHVDGKRVKVVRGAALGKPVKLRGLPRRRFKLRVTLRLDDGRTVKGTRGYRACKRRR